MGTDMANRVHAPKQWKAAAVLLARGETWLSVETQLRIGPRTLGRWHREPEFMAVVAEEKQAIVAAIRAEGIANKQNRIDAYNERWTKQQQVIAARAADASMSEQAGARTGLLVRTYKPQRTYRQVSSDEDTAGEETSLIEEYAVDTGLLREMRELEKQAAQEVGDWDTEVAAAPAQKVYIGIFLERV